jgi:adenylate cyclase
MVASSGITAWMISRNLLTWIWAHSTATEAVAKGQFDYRIRDVRPDELGQLTDKFNDMVADLGQAKIMHETFGQVVSPQVRDALLKSFHGLGGELREVTVLFADIRGFTRRSAKLSPEEALRLVNRFMTLAVSAIQDQDGLVNKFLGDGVMALFNAPDSHPDHADRAVMAARRLLSGLETLNYDLVDKGDIPLRVGIGIHTGMALAGCVGASLPDASGRTKMRREYTAIGETINLGQRLEQMTKKHGGPVLMSEATWKKLKRDFPAVSLGAQPVPGYEGELVVYRLEWP